ncbi:hypothetical protein DPMN_095548 [Dreissena polymorpha]|uniref:Uncharacterized protein n=1 Tax=Dreissena polymorpha TaxID=45954 RepID=A0A9D4L6P9_DREPO|nr:hypothetical protein DPMN_095548 [Dreissena polymorpha]
MASKLTEEGMAYVGGGGRHGFRRPFRDGGPKSCSDINYHALHRTVHIWLQEKRAARTTPILNRRQPKINYLRVARTTNYAPA